MTAPVRPAPRAIVSAIMTTADATPPASTVEIVERAYAALTRADLRAGRVVEMAFDIDTPAMLTALAGP